MKKLIVILLSGILCFSLVSCGNKDKKEETKPTTTKEAQKEDNKAEKGKSEETKSFASLENKVYDSNELKINITNIEVVSAKDVTTSKEDGKVLLFYYDVTNKTHDQLEAESAWVSTFEVLQKDTPLYTIPLDKSKLSIKEIQSVKKDETLKSVVGYKLQDDSSQVTLGTIDKDSGFKDETIQLQ